MPTQPAAPSLEAVRGLAKSHGLKKCIVVFQLPDNSFGYTSYGWSRAECSNAKAAGDRLYHVFETALLEELS